MIRKRTARTTRTLDAILDNVYTSPSLDYLQRYGLEPSYLFGEVRFSGMEITTGWTDEGEFVALLTARLFSVLGDMAACLAAPTFPVHDEPWEEP